MTTDRELMHRVAQGDERAFADLANRYSARLLTVAWRLLGNRADAEDAVQRALLRLFQSAASYRPEWAVSTWLYRVATNVCVDEIRRRQSRTSLQKVVRQGPARVPLEARILLALRYVDGLSYQELARVRGISVNTVKSQLARGKSIVREALLDKRRRLKPAARIAKGAGE